MMLLFVLFVLATFLSASDAFTCRNYDNDKCVSVGCDVHCTALGKKGGYCTFGGSYCTCNCFTSDAQTSELPKYSLKNDLAVRNIIGDSYAVLFNGTKSDDQPCDCMYAGSCYSCGAQVGTLACFKGCGWRVCTSPTCITNACRGIAC